MRFPLRALFARSIAIALLGNLFLTLPASNAKESLVSLLPKSERSIFILDISNSTNVKSNWNKSLRPSIIKKLRSQPFGMPMFKGQKTMNSPVDISVSSITSNSIDAPIFPIVTIEDAKKMWGLIDDIGSSPTQKRLELIISDLFGGNGAFTNLSEIFLGQPVSVPAKSTCVTKTVSYFSTGTFMRDISPREKSDSASTLCDLAIGISNRLKAVDSYFEKPDCGSSGACSDVIGAILSMSYAASDLFEKSPQSKLCIAIASDMLNSVPGLKSDSLLNSRRVAENAKSIEDAKEKGTTVAQLVGISFPKKMSIRVFVLGQGSGKKPLPLDKNAMLTAYWQGFFESAGIKVSPSPSLDQACSK